MGAADRDDPAVDVDEQLGVDAVRAVLAGQQVRAVAPVERGDQGPVHEDDLAGEQGGKVLVGGAQGVGEEGDHDLVVVPGGGPGNGEVLVQVVVGGVAAQPAQTQAQRLDQGQRLRPPDRPVPVGNSSSASWTTTAAAFRLRPGR